MTAIEAIDSHVHVGLEKYQPIEAFLAVMERVGMRRAVLVQHIGQLDNGYLAACLQRFPRQLAGIGAVDPSDPGALDRLDGLATVAGFVGVRLAAAARSPGPDPLAIWKRTDDLGLVVSVRGPFEDVASPEFAEIVAGCARARFRLEHLGCHRPADDRPPHDRFRRLLALAAFPNTFIQLSGFYLNSTSPYPYPSSAEPVRLAYRAFGAERMMWSGDWNRPDLARGEYEREMTVVGDVFPVDTPADRAMIMGGTAARLFGFEAARHNLFV
jgi:L-fuconolactonase